MIFHCHFVAILINSQSYGILRDIFNFVPHLADLRLRDRWGRTPFLAACSLVGYSAAFESGVTVQKMALLLDKGGSIHERDSGGRTCLHLLFSCPLWALSKNRWKDPLIYLIRRGADVHAKDDFGLSVSYYAYTKSCRDERPLSYRGDLWDAALDACGHDIREFRKGYPRTARYTAKYKRSDFEALWKGREDRCPYWKDTDWSSPDDEMSGQYDQSGSAEVICHCDGDHCYYGYETETQHSPSWSEDNGRDDKIGGADLAFEFPSNGLSSQASMPGTASPRSASPERQHQPSNWASPTADELHIEQIGEAASLAHHQQDFFAFQHGELVNNPWSDVVLGRVTKVEGDGDDNEAEVFLPWIE